MGRKQKYRSEDAALIGNKKAQQKKRSKFKETGFQTMELLLSSTTQSLLFSAMRKNGYPNYSTGASRGKVLDVSNYLTSIIRKVSTRKLKYGECKMADEIWFIHETIKHLRCEQELKPSECLKFLQDNSYKIPNYFESAEWNTDIIKKLSHSKKVTEIITEINTDCYENGKRVKMPQLTD
ncbi:hypothetical protein [Hydrogenovibrio marinus]|uniref:Uncharacterized protein n=1 Tax=Hydrogenovibrio marinus TaxID=28885 RepID=A0A066ZWD0_HYDMR|nr:hypothetical protein [Hydrogenovibrio marinus]KDN96584.1 hypothetical protein EI16_10040 [Hydrogenovibrio marinus]BBN60206.1 hypothetical protein HVMH_1800 [Hydrogenovibrio marinus]